MCGDPKAGHDRIHPFTPPGEALPTNFFRPGKVAPPQNVQLPYDLVLRQALVDLGVVTTDDLRAAAEKVTAIVIGGEVSGDDAGPEQGK